MPKFSEILSGKKGKIKQATTLTPDQEELMKLIKQGLESGEGAFGDIFGEFDKEAFEEGVSTPALKQFQADILPQIQEKFIAGNQALGSGMRRAQMKGATDLQDKLAQLMYQAKQDQQKNKLAGLQTALGVKGFENVYKPGMKGGLQALVEGFSENFGKGLGNQLTGGGGGGDGGAPQISPQMIAAIAG